jgi:hypothetical protein
MLKVILACFLTLFSRENILRALIPTFLLLVFLAAISSFEKMLRKAPGIIRFLLMILAIVEGLFLVIFVSVEIFTFVGIGF